MLMIKLVDRAQVINLTDDNFVLLFSDFRLISLIDANNSKKKSLTIICFYFFCSVGKLIHISVISASVIIGSVPPPLRCARLIIRRFYASSHLVKKIDISLASVYCS